MDASGRPTLKDALIAASSFGPILGFARPISSYAITDSLLTILSKSPISSSLAK